MGMTRPPRAITIDDVAYAAGVSAKTVSRVLNNEPNVRASKREMVMKAARELGYRPNPAARSLAGAKSFLIAHLHDNPVPEYISAVNAGIYQACRAKGYFLLPEPVDRSAPDFLDRLQQFLMTSRADGVVLTPPLCDDADILALLQQNETAYASLSPSRQPERTPVMRLDDRHAAMEVVRHLIKLGHKRIGFIAGPDGHNASTGRREGRTRMRASSPSCSIANWAASAIAGAVFFPSGSLITQPSLSSLTISAPRTSAEWASADTTSGAAISKPGMFTGRRESVSTSIGRVVVNFWNGLGLALRLSGQRRTP